MKEFDDEFQVIKQEHSNKYCWCGGHNHSNAKKNKNHNSTKKRMTIKNIRRFLAKMFKKELK